MNLHNNMPMFDHGLQQSNHLGINQHDEMAIAMNNLPTSSPNRNRNMGMNQRGMGYGRNKKDENIFESGWNTVKGWFS